jgi:hypothetical protein|tara:strand:+ start:10650 stop:11012 length:363 start_codon:yes stop_codon:yes gene_type:complete
MDIGGNGIVNTNAVPADVIVYSTAPDDGSQTIKLSGNGAMSAAVYAPYAAMEMKGSGSGGTMLGAVIADTILMTGNFEFHFDESLKEVGSSSDFSMEQWRILYDGSDRYNDILALASTGL